MAFPLQSAMLTGARQARAAVGFTRAHTFAFWFIFSGAMLGFCLARGMYLDFRGVFCAPGRRGRNHAAPGECFWYTTHDVYRVGVQMHLYAILPAGALACVQFVPVIRHRLLLLHRVNGYIVLLLSLVGVTGAVMIAPVAFGGDLSIRSQLGVLAIMFVGCLMLAYYYIKRLRIDQHRAWMLRAWFYAGSIVTTRIILSISAIIISSGDVGGGFYEPKPCRQLASYMNAAVLRKKYPECVSLDAWALVKADMHAKSPENISAALDLTFGMAVWVAFILHAVGVEAYLQLTPGETQRLREISLQRQAAAMIEAASKEVASEQGENAI